MERIAARVVGGLPLKFSLALETPVIPLHHWQKSLAERPALCAWFTKKCAEGLQEVIELINKADNLRKLPARIWTIQRAFPEEFAEPKPAPQVTVNNRMLIGIQDGVLRRARAAVFKASKVAPLAIERIAHYTGPDLR